MSTPRKKHPAKRTPRLSMRDAERPSPRLNTTMPRELQDEMKAAAKANGLTFAAALAGAARMWLDLFQDA